MSLNEIIDAVIDDIPKDVLPDWLVKRQYVRSAIDLVKKESLSGCVGDWTYREAALRFSGWEEEFANRGYITEAPWRIAFWDKKGLLDALGRRRHEKEPYLYAPEFCYAKKLEKTHDPKR